MARGRKPVPDKIKKLRGTRQKCRERGEGVVGELIPSAEVLCSYRADEGLSDRAKNIFRQRCEGLIQLGLLTEPDLDQLAIYAELMDIIYLCFAEIRATGIITAVDTGLGGIKYIGNPYFAQLNKSIIMINKIGSEYGFTPVSRLKLKLSEKKKESPLQALKNL